MDSEKREKEEWARFDQLEWTKKIDDKIELEELNECIQMITDFYISRAEMGVKSVNLDPLEELKSVYEHKIKHDKMQTNFKQENKNGMEPS